MPPVTIPQFNHHTIQQILERNQSLLNMIKECQDNGWMDDAKIYQKRLTSNVSFLGCLADAVVPLQTSHINNLGATAANSADHHLAHGFYPDVPASSSRQDIIDSLPAPIMVKVPETKEKVESKNYAPVLPLVGNNYERDIALSNLVLVDPKVSRSILMSRLVPSSYEKIHAPPSTFHANSNSAKGNRTTKTTPLLASQRSALNSNGPNSFLSPGLINSAERNGNGGGSGQFGSNNALALFSDLAPDESDLSDEEYKQPEEEEDDEDEEDEGDEEDDDEESPRSLKIGQNSEHSSDPLLGPPEESNEDMINDFLSVFHDSSSMHQNQPQQQQQTFYGQSVPTAAEDEIAPYFRNNFDPPQQQQQSFNHRQQDSFMSNGIAPYHHQVASSTGLQFQQDLQMMQQPCSSFPSYHQEQQQQRLMSDQHIIPMQQQQFLNAPSQQQQHQSQVMQPPPSLVAPPQMNQLDLLTMQLQALPPNQQLLLIQQLTQRVQQQQQHVSIIPGQSLELGVSVANDPNSQYQYMMSQQQQSQQHQQQHQQQQHHLENPQVSFIAHQFHQPQHQSSPVQPELELDDFFDFKEAGGGEEEEKDGDIGKANGATDFYWD